MIKLAVLGNPIAHSRSPEIHEAFARQSGITLSYERILVQAGEFRDVANGLIRDGYRGFNVTVPFKGDACQFVQSRSLEARIAHAVNTVIVNDDGSVLGHNTDGIGLLADLHNHGWAIKDKKVLLVGAGGAARGVLGVLVAAGPTCVHLVNRTHERAVELAGQHDPRVVQAIRLPDDGVEAGEMAAYDLVISASSAGLLDSSVNLPTGTVGSETACYDMIYGASTPFLDWCREQGALRCADGLGMLVEQAAAAFTSWFNVSVASGPVIEQLRTGSR